MSEQALRRVVLLDDSITDEIYSHVFRSLDREVGGVLVGKPADDYSVAVCGAIPALDAVQRAAAVTFTHDAWERIHGELDRRFTGSQIVGWYHSHPGFGIFLSEADLFIHRSFFDSWWQFAHVIDPLSREEGTFVWRDSEVVQRHEARVDFAPLATTTTTE
jgi:proteasome lid subunit RPN8/RPN11